MPLRRHFVDLDDRQIHVRVRGGIGPTLVVLHASPGSSAQMVPLMQAIDDRRVIAPDLAGLGDSDAHPKALPTMADFASDSAAAIERLADGPVDLYGSHTGACVATELAATRPDLVRRVVLDGVPLWSDAERAELAARYAPAVQPDPYGAHLLWAHHYCRDQLLFWPWYDKSAAAARCIGLPPARELHRLVVEVVKSIETYHLGYHAAFAYPITERLRAVMQPTLCLSTKADPLGLMTARIATLLADARVRRIGDDDALPAPDHVAGAIMDFLAA
ncbi:alpha/beta fold hydrolase [Sphingomonas hylomeconis]|nr:alpha/beta hydrolase [Sphingomonas hylomeconis]